MDWNAKINDLERNTVTVARQIDYLFQQIWKKAILSGMHLTNQILNYEKKRESKGRGVEHPLAVVCLTSEPKINENHDKKVISFINKYVISYLIRFDTFN